MSNLTEKIMNAVYAHPKLIVYCIGLAMTFTITAIIAETGVEQAFATGGQCSSCRYS